MRYTLAVVACLGFLWCVSALPATSKQIDDSVEFLNPKKSYGDQPIIDTGVVGYDEESYNPFGGLFESLENMMIRMRQQMDSLLRRFPGIQSGNSSDGGPDFPEIAGFPKLDLDLGKGNTTSVTKIIDGHKVVINQTQYHKDDDLGSAFFQVRIIDVQPEDGATEKDAEAVPKDRESIENTAENEILKHKEAISYHPHLETFDEVDYSPHFVPRFTPAETNRQWNEFNSVVPVDDNSINFEPYRDLSRDTYVNELLANSGATTNPDAEIIEIVPQGSRRGPIERFQNPRIPR